MKKNRVCMCLCVRERDYEIRIRSYRNYAILHNCSYVTLRYITLRYVTLRYNYLPALQCAASPISHEKYMSVPSALPSASVNVYDVGDVSPTKMALPSN